MKLKNILNVDLKFSVSSAILSGSVFGIVGRFSPKFITAAVGGQALGGIFAALAQIAALTLDASSTRSALVYFIVGDFMVILTLISYIILSRTVFFRYHTSEKTGITSNEFRNEMIRPRIVNHRVIFKKILPHAFSAFIVFLITLSVYPGITVLIESENYGKGNPWNGRYLHFMIYNRCSINNVNFAKRWHY